jgi:hypothetical protein
MTDASTDIETSHDIDDGELREYYEQVADVWATTATFDIDDATAESLIVPGTKSNGTKNWYKYTHDTTHIDAADAPDADADDLFAGRAWSPVADRDELVDPMFDDFWDYRLPHLTINYQQRGLDDWATKVSDDDGGSHWAAGSNPLPNHGEFDAVALWADVDFSADEKRRPVDVETRDRVETILQHWVDQYGDVVDDRDAVAVLDSVGGTYVMLRPAATRPIYQFAADELTPAERHEFDAELQDRWRGFNDDVNDAADDWDGFEKDGDTNKNRLFKAPLAVHKELPGIVTPIETDDIEFSFTHWDDVDDSLIEQTRDWAQWFTQNEPEKADDWAGAILDELFDDVDAGSWRSDIKDWAQKRDETDATAQTDAVRNADIDPEQLAGELTFVSQSDYVWDSIYQLDCETVAEELNIVSTSDKADADKKTLIEVNWRKSGSGDSAYVGHSGFTDMDGHEPKGNAADLVAYTLIGSDTQEPADWRKNGEHRETVLDWFLSQGRFDIPLYIPEQGSTFTTDDGDTQTLNRTPDWAIRRVADVLDIAPGMAFDDETDACTIPRLFNRILDVLDVAGIDHNRERRDVRLDAAGDAIVEKERDIDVDELIDDSPADIPDANAGDDADSDDSDGETADAGDADAADSDAAGDRETDTDGDPTPADAYTTADDDDETADTWAAYYDIHERDSVDDLLNVDVPGVELQWIELADGRAGWGWQYTYQDSDGIEQVAYDFVLNADIELLSRLDYPGRRDQQTEWRVRINPTVDGEPSREMTLTPAAFNSSRELRDALIGQTESVVFNPQGKGTKAVNELKQLLHAQEAPRRKAHEKIELVDGDDGAVFVTPNGTVDSDGWIDEPTHVFESVADGIQGDWQADPDDVGTADDDLVADVCELLPRIRDDREQWLSMLGYAFASCLRPVLFNQDASRVNTWNLLHVSGKSGAGKSAVAKTLSGALGMNAKSTTGAEKTSHAQEHMFSATNGMPVAMDEYNPENWANWKADAFHEHLKKSTDAQSIEKGNPDQSLTEYRFEVSPIVLGEQQLPESMPALPRRAVEVTLQTVSTARGTETAERFNELRELTDDDWGLGLHHHALDWWAHVCDAAESPLDVINDWHATRDWLRDEMNDRGIDLNADLPRAMHQQGLQTVAFGLRRWRQFAVDRGADPALLFDDADIIDTVEHLIGEKTGEHASSVDNEAAMLELLADAAAVRDDGGEMSVETQPYVAYGDQYTLLNVETGEPTELRIHLKSTLRQLSKFSRDYGLDATIYQKSDYYRWFKSSAENPDSMVLDASQRTHLQHSQKRCVAVDFEQLTDELDIHPDDLLPGHIDDVADEQDTADSDDDDSDDDGPEYQQEPDVDLQPIGDIDADDQLVASAAGNIEIGKWDGINDDDGRPYFTATLSDETGDAELVIWDKEQMPPIWDDDGTIGPDTLLVKNAKPGTYDEKLQLIAQSDTVIQPAQAGVGETAMPDADANEQLASTDGGTAAYSGDAEPQVKGDETTKDGTSDTTADETGDDRETDASDADSVDGDPGDDADSSTDTADGDPTADETDADPTDDDPDEQQTGDADDDDSDDNTDDVTSGMKRAVYQELRKRDTGDEFTAADIATRLGMSADTATAALDSITQKQKVIEAISDGYRKL